MSGYSQVVWSEGLFLRPEHLQQQDRHQEWHTQARCQAIQAWYWGFESLEFDHVALQQGQCHLRRAKGVLPDGTPFDFPHLHPAPPAINLPETLEHAVTVCLVLPQPGLGGPDTGWPPPANHHPSWLNWRYRATPLTVHDRCAPPPGQTANPVSLEVAVPQFGLWYGDKPIPDGMTGLAVCRLLPGSQSPQVRLDTEHIPPLLQMQASPKCWQGLRHLHQRLQSQRAVLRHRLSASPTTDPRAWLAASGLQKHQALLGHWLDSGHLHPEDCFRALLVLAAELDTWADSPTDTHWPRYQHGHLERCLPSLWETIENRLAFWSRPQAVPIPLRSLQQGRYLATWTEPDWLDATRWEWVLQVQAHVPSEALRQRWPQQTKIGPAEKLREIVNLQLPGLPLRALPQVPSGLPVAPEAHCFALDSTHALWAELRHSTGLGLYVTGDYPGLEVNLWAIAR